MGGTIIKAPGSFTWTGVLRECTPSQDEYLSLFRECPLGGLNNLPRQEPHLPHLSLILASRAALPAFPQVPSPKPGGQRLCLERGQDVAGWERLRETSCCQLPGPPTGSLSPCNCSCYTCGSLHLGCSPAHPQPLPVTDLRCASASLPGSLCWPHTSKNQLALPSGRA